VPVRLAAVLVVGAPVVGVLVFVFEIAFAFANLIEHGDIGLPRMGDLRFSHTLALPFRRMIR
jgi:hypothetical protein